MTEMTDKEKAEEYVLNVPDTVGAKHSVYSEEKLKQAYLDGLAEGRNETLSEGVIKNLKENTSVINSIIINKLSEKCEQLEKEKCELLGIIQKKDEVIAELKMKLLTLENKEQVVTTTVSN